MSSCEGKTPRSVVGLDEMIAGHPLRAKEEIEMRSRLEVIKEEVDTALRVHKSLAEGSRESWLNKIERRNEEDAYQVRVSNHTRCERQMGFGCLQEPQPLLA